MTVTQQASPLKLDTPAGWWRCIHSSGQAPFDKFEIGKLYPCVQDGPGVDIRKRNIPVTHRSYRIYSDASKVQPGGWSPYWDYPKQRFCYDPATLNFEFVRRFTRAEQDTLCDQGCPPEAFASARTANTDRARPRSFLDVILGRARKRSKGSEVQPKTEAPLRYYFEYKSTAEGKRAVVFKRTHEWGIAEVGSFKYGVDAKEYVDIKNVQLRRQNT